MDPGTTISQTVSLAKHVHNVAIGLYDRYFGHSGNDKLKLVTNALRDLVVSLEPHLEDADARANDGLPHAQHLSTDSLNTVLLDCKMFFNSFESAIIQGSRQHGATKGPQMVAQQNAFNLDIVLQRVNAQNAELLRSMQRQMLAMQRASIVVPRRTNTESISPRSRPLAYPPGVPPVDESLSLNAGSPRSARSPTLRPVSRAPTIASVSELPPAIIGDAHSPYVGPATHETSPAVMAAAPVMNLISKRGPPLRYPTSIAEDDEIQHGPALSPKSNRHRSSTPHASPIIHCRDVHLSLGKDKLCTFNSYTVYDNDGVRIIQLWSTMGEEISHIIPQEPDDIPYTIPNDGEFKAQFLPRETKHMFKIEDRDGLRDLEGRPIYQFTHKADREVFQQQVRNRQTLKMFRTVTIRTDEYPNLGRGVHVKVWRRNEYDDQPTLSFPHKREGPMCQDEYVLRWFDRKPQCRGDTKLVLKPNPTHGDLNHSSPEPEISKRGTFSFVRRKSSTSLSGRSGSVKPQPSLFYELPRLHPPEDLSDIEIDFQTEQLRQSFIAACWEVHQVEQRPVSRVTTEPTMSSDLAHSPRGRSRPPSFQDTSSSHPPSLYQPTSAPMTPMSTISIPKQEPTFLQGGLYLGPPAVGDKPEQPEQPEQPDDISESNISDYRTFYTADTRFTRR